MSADGQGDTIDLNKEKEPSACNDTPLNPKNSTDNEEANSIPSKDDDATNTALGSVGSPSNPELDALDEDVEAVIEKKLISEKIKAPDVDSELDFELKYDEDADDDLAKIGNDALQTEAVITASDNPDGTEANASKDLENLQLKADKKPDDDSGKTDTDAMTPSDESGRTEELAPKDSENSELKYDEDGDDDLPKMATDAMTPSDEPDRGNAAKDLENLELKYDDDGYDNLAKMDTEEETLSNEPDETKGNAAKDLDDLQLKDDEKPNDYDSAKTDTAAMTPSDKSGRTEELVAKDLENLGLKYDEDGDDDLAKMDTDAMTPSDRPGRTEGLAAKDLDDLQLKDDEKPNDDSAKTEPAAMTPSDGPDRAEGNAAKDLENLELKYDEDDDDIDKMDTDAVTPSDECDRTEGNATKDLENLELKHDKDGDDDLAKMDTDVVSPSNEPDKTEKNAAKDFDNSKLEYDVDGDDKHKMDTDALTSSEVPDRTEDNVAKDLENVDALEINPTSKPLEDAEKIPTAIFKIDTDKKIDLVSKILSPVESETNSLDEHLVYSDVEVPEIEDKDLLDEIDAHILDTESKSNDERFEDEGTKTPVLPEIIPTTSNEGGNQNNDSTALDADDGLIESVIVKEEENLNDSIVSASDMETSVFEINNEHRLTKPDVMIEIPTQEMIEALDDSGEISDGAEQYDEDMLLNNDQADAENFLTDLIQIAEVSTNEKEIVKEMDVSDKLNLIDVNKVASAAEENEMDVAIESSVQANDALESKSIETENKITEIMDTTKIKNKPENGIADEGETTKSGEDNVENKDKDSTDKENIADIILEATTLEPKQISDENPDLGPKAVTVTENTDSHDKTHSDQKTDAKKDTFNESEQKPVSEEENTTPDTLESQVKEAKDGNSNDSEPKGVKETPVSSTDVPQPSTSKYLLQELSDEDQEVTDSLGLLAESSRVMDDDDEQEQDQDPEDDDDDDDFDQDDESNLMTAEHSEDSNAQQSESDVPREVTDAEESPTLDKEDFQFEIGEVVSAKDVEALVKNVKLEAEERSEVETAVQALLGEIQAEPEDDVSPAAAIAEEDTVKLSEDAEETEDDGKQDESSKLRQLLLKDKEAASATTEPHKSPSKVKKLEIAKPKHEISIVELEESSSEDDIQEVNKQPAPSPTDEVTDEVSVNIPLDVEVMSASSGAMSGLRRAPREYVISVPKPPPSKPARLNTSEVSIKTTSVPAEPLAIPDSATPSKDKTSLKFGLEIFSLDSDDDEKTIEPSPKKLTAVELERARESNKCINMYCTSDGTEPRLPTDARCAAYYNSARRGAVCLPCALAVAARTQNLIDGVKDFRPLLTLDMGQTKEECVEISDSDSEDEPDIVKDADDVIGEVGAKFLEDNLADMFNATWRKFNMDARLLEAQDELDIDVKRLEAECSEIDTLLTDCQVATDKLRRDLYDSFASERKELPAIVIFDTPPNTWSGLEEGIMAYENKEIRQSKRRLAASAEPPAKRPAIPLGYTPLDSDANTTQSGTQEAKAAAPAAPAPPDVAAPNDDDNADISVVKLSAESAPAGLPPPGPLTRAPLRAGMPVHAMRNAYGTWLRARIVEVQPKSSANQFTMCRVKFEHKVKNPCKVLPARCLAYDQPASVRMTIGTRVIALFKGQDNKRESYYSGIIAEIPNPVNSYRYLVFFDDGYAQYVTHAATRLVCECASLVWDEVHPFSRQFVRDYLRAFPERPMVRAHAGQSLKTEYNGKWWVSKVVKVDASLVQVHFEEEDRYEWIYRGSTRLAPLFLELQAAERQRARPLPRAQPGRRFNMPYVEYTRSDEPASPAATTAQQIEQEIRRQRAVAKKSTALPPAPPAAPLDGVTSRVVFYTPKNAIRPHKMVPHTCSPKCKRTDVLALKDLRTYNPLTKPLLSGWERQIVKFRWNRSVMYRAPCGRRLRDYRELHHYLQMVDSDMGVDLFDFGVNTHCLAEFVLNKCLISKKDLSNGRENVPVPCVNYYDDSLPEFCSYNTERTPTAGVPLNLDPEFLCGCDCTDDCTDKSKCACWKMTLEGARTIGLDTSEVGYVYKRLPEPLPSGIYECNSRCKCKQTCLNRVAQHPLQLKLQVFKTLNRGWGIRALNDVPKGAFLCVYAGNLLTDATANLDGLNEGDEYLAELDYIEVVEQMKEGFEEDIPDEDKKLDKKEGGSPASSSSEEVSSEEEGERGRGDEDDDDFRPTERLVRSAVPEYSKRLRKREKAKKKEEEQEKQKEKEKEGSSEDNCITISDDEELREPARFAAQAGMGGKEFISKHKSVRAHFGKDEACYIMDAKVQGNIGRYLNHSCTPNVFVQNVFVDTHDPRFPWVAFFALAHIRAGTELTWNYNYDVGSVPGKVLYCHCAAPNCRGRLL